MTVKVGLLRWPIPSLQDLIRANLKKEGEKKTIWSDTLTEPVPDDLLGKAGHYIQLGTQMIVSKITEAAGMAAFLMEESVQAVGMGAYLLYTSGDWRALDEYLEHFDTVVTAAEEGGIGLATLNPLIGGVALIYFDSARIQVNGMIKALRAQIGKQARRLGIAVTEEMTNEQILDAIDVAEAEKIAEKIDEENKYGTLALRSSPSSAEIWIDGENTELLTPETFKRLDVGDHVITLFKYSKRREVTDSYTFEIEIVPGRRKEVFIHIPEDATGEGEAPEKKEEDDTPKLPDFIKAEVTGDYALDGDTFQTTAGERVRILGIDTPELGRPYADLAKEYTASLIEDKKITLRIQTFLPIDKYGRTLAICDSYKGNIAILLLSAGLARAFIAEDATYDPARYLEAERIAKERRIGIWSEMP